MDVPLTIETLTRLFGWMTLLNFALLALSAVLLLSLRGPIAAIHGRMAGITPEEARRAYFAFLANYKIGILLLNLAPYLALRIIA